MFAAVAYFAVGFFYMGCLSSFTTIAQLRLPASSAVGVVSVLMMMLGVGGIPSA